MMKQASPFSTGVFFWFGYPLPLGARMDLIRESGFDNVVLWWSDEFAFTDGTKAQRVECARSSGLFVESAHATFAKINDIWFEDSDTSALFDYYDGCLREAAAMDIPSMMFHITGGPIPPSLSQCGIDFIKRLAETAEDCGITMLLENIWKPEYLDAIFAQIDSPRVRFCFDSGHEFCRSPGTDLLERYRDRLSALHLHDNDGAVDRHLIPGDGAISWDNVAERLVRASYRGSFTLEISCQFNKQYAHMKPEEYLLLAQKQARNLADRVRAGLEPIQPA